MIKWNEIKKEYERVNQELINPNLDSNKRGDLQKKASHYANLLALHEQLEAVEQEVVTCKEGMKTEEDDLKLLFEEELAELEKKQEHLNSELADILYPADERDARSVFLEIRAGAGGQEAALFVNDLFRMYHNFGLTKNWNVSIVDQHTTDIGGYKELVVHITGKKVYKFLKFESGVHRVQRVPQTETQGRVHTSTVTVAVLPEAKEVDIAINPQDLRIDVFRASGAGGQHVNTTDSAVRITHLPTGVVVSCQDERSQMKNKSKAMKVLRSRLLEAERKRIHSERSEQRKQQVGTGDRAEKIRTYNFPQNRITDHRINLTLKKLDIVMQGEMDDLLEPLQKWDQQQRKQNATV